ncbi:phage tail protein [Novispirillum itersonii]|uniref:Microcystin-dependent protein n=1 Tax=Novispirillum itersonii TaxID=189 RepID=A0A7X0DNH7_NOVIT|nr:tail fiber protein [Novispirillum itersonii]MBB6210257.1 microcystin-dependent protein [Novispirillum itersonii]
MSESMSDIDDMTVFLGEIRLFAGPFVPVGWAECDGAELPVRGNDALHALLKNTFGGDGVTKFNLPDLRGRVVVSCGAGPSLTLRTVGDVGGEDVVALTQEEMPPHSHPFAVENVEGTMEGPETGKSRAVVLANMAAISGGAVGLYGKADIVATKPVEVMAAAVMDPVGSGEAHSNIMPSIGLRYIIALRGMYPAPQ